MPAIELFVLLGFPIFFIVSVFVVIRYLKKGEFEKYSELPPEMQMWIINRMDTISRSRFSQCSKKSNAQVKESEDYIDELKLYYSFGAFFISVRYCNKSIGISRGFKLWFVSIGDSKYIKCHSLQHKDMWAKELDNSVNLIDTGIQKFKELLNIYQNKIKTLTIDVRSRSNIDFGITRMNKLEALEVVGEHDACEFLSKTQNDLETLSIEVQHPEYVEKLKICEKLYRVKKILILRKIALNNHQFLQLSASKVRMNIGQLTEANIFDFIKSWKNGTIGKKVEKYVWKLNSNFDSIRLFQWFGELHDGFSDKKVKISHNIEDGKTATLGFEEISERISVLRFETVETIQPR